MYITILLLCPLCEFEWSVRTRLCVTFSELLLMIRWKFTGWSFWMARRLQSCMRTHALTAVNMLALLLQDGAPWSFLCVSVPEHLCLEHHKITYIRCIVVTLIEFHFLQILNCTLCTSYYLVFPTETSVDDKTRIETHSLVMTSKQSIILLIVCNTFFFQNVYGVH